MANFTKIDPHTFAFTFPPQTYGKQNFTLTIDLNAKEVTQSI